MKVFFLLYLIVGGIDNGPPAIEVESMEECQRIVGAYLEKGKPDGVEIMRVGCVREVAQEQRS